LAHTRILEIGDQAILMDRKFEPGPTLAAIENEKLNIAWFALVMVGMPDEC
jgi:hypothetical protein